MRRARAEELAEGWGLSLENDSGEHTIAQRDAVLGAVGRILVAENAEQLGRALVDAAELCELVEAIVSEELDDDDGGVAFQTDTARPAEAIA